MTPNNNTLVSQLPIGTTPGPNDYIIVDQVANTPTGFVTNKVPVGLTGFGGGGGGNSVFGANNQIAFNKGGTESGDANLTWQTTNTLLTVGNSSSNIQINSISIGLGNLSINSSTLSVGNSSVNATINSTVYTGKVVTANTANNATNLGGVGAANYLTNTGSYTISGVFSHIANISVNGAIFANGSNGAIGQVLTSAGTGNAYWSTVSLSAPGSNTQIFFNNSGAEAGDANLTWTTGGPALLTIGNSTVNNQINSTFIQLGNAGISLNSSTILIGNSTVNTTINSTSMVVANSTSNAIHTLSTIELGNSTVNTVINSTALVMGNTTVNLSINSTSFSGTSNNSLNLGGVAAASYLTNTGNFIISGIYSHIANLSVNGAFVANGGVGGSGQVLTSAAGGNVYWSTVSGGGGGPFGSTTQIAFNNAGSETGDANLTWTTASAKFIIGLVGVTNSVQIIPNLLTIGNSTVNSTVNSTSFSGTAAATLTVGSTSAANVVSNAQLASNLANYSLITGALFSGDVNVGSNVVLSTSSVYVGNSTENTVHVNAGLYVLGGIASGNVTLNATSLFFGNSTVNALVNSTVFTGTSNNTSFVGSVSAGNVVSNAQLASNLASYALIVGQTFTGDVNVGSNVIISTSGLLIGNSTVNALVNSTVFTGTSNNATNLGGVAAASYALLSGADFSGDVNVGSNVIISTSGLLIGNTNLNSISLFLGNSTVNALVNSTVFTGTSNNTTNLGGVAAANYLTNTGNYTISGIYSHIANLSVNGQIIANGGGGTAGQALTSGGTGQNNYWSTISGGGGGPFGSTTQIAFNNAGTESGDANLTWTTGSTRLSVGNTTVNTQINGTSISINGVVVNSTSFPATANNTLFVGSTSAANVVSNTQLQANLALYGPLGGFINPVISSNVSGLNVSTQGAITSGTNALALDYLTSFLNGMSIMVVGAGVSGANLISTVLSGGGTTSLVLANAAGTTVTSAFVYTVGSITSGSANLTLASTVGWKAGLGIDIAGAGAAGADLITTVSSVTNSTSMVLAATASTTVTNKPVNYDDTAALNTVFATGQNIWMPNGQYNVTSFVTTGDQWIQGSGLCSYGGYFGQGTIIFNRGKTNNVFGTGGNSTTILRDFTIQQANDITPTAGYGLVLGSGSGDSQSGRIENIIVAYTYHSLLVQGIQSWYIAGNYFWAGPATASPMVNYNNPAPGGDIKWFGNEFDADAGGPNLTILNFAQADTGVWVWNKFNSFGVAITTVGLASNQGRQNFVGNSFEGNNRGGSGSGAIIQLSSGVDFMFTGNQFNLDAGLGVFSITGSCGPGTIVGNDMASGGVTGTPYTSTSTNGNWTYLGNSDGTENSSLPGFLYCPGYGGTVISLYPVTIANLPAANSVPGGRATISNGITSPTYHQAVSSTGTATQPVYSNGTVWWYD